MVLNRSIIANLRLNQVIWSVLMFSAQLVNQGSVVPLKWMLALATCRCSSTWYTKRQISLALTQLTASFPGSPQKMGSTSVWCECWWSLVEGRGLVQINSSPRFSELNNFVVMHTLSCCMYSLEMLPFSKIGIIRLELFFIFFRGILNK